MNCSICSREIFCSNHPAWYKKQTIGIVDQLLEYIYFPREKFSGIIDSSQKKLQFNNEWKLWINGEPLTFVACQEKVSKGNLHSVSINFVPYYKGIIVQEVQ